MDSPGQDHSTLQGLGLMILAVIAGGIFWYQSPLTSSRPPASSTQKLLIQEQEDVLARLWEDPMAAVARFREKERRQPDKDSPNTLARVAAQIRQIDTPSIEVVMVMVPGSPYAEGRELRLRSRYAILSGLSVAGYVPSDAEHLGFFPFSASTVESAIIPYEWFHTNRLKAPVQQNPVLLLWLNDHNFSSQPLTQVAELIQGLRDQVATLCPSAPPRQSSCNLQFRLVGPTGSTTLATMIQEIQEWQQHPTQTLLKLHLSSLQNLAIYSPWATAANALLTPAPLDDSIVSRDITPPHTRIVNLFQEVGITLHRTVHSDAYLAEALIDELALRGVNIQANGPSPPTDHVVILAEWDTFYARALPLTFAAAAALPESQESPLHFERMLRTLQKGHASTWPSWIHRFSYLRGLDGEVPIGEKDKASPPATKENHASPKPRLALTDFERAQGTSQFDYLRSLVASITTLQQQLQRQCWETHELLDPCPTVKAIGILGSDVYDKLLVLQALRQHFPNVLFFTTDLDARLFYPDDFRWTRNMIVASSYGLSLHPTIQSDIPPFRDQYQTGLFYSGLRALNYPFPKDIHNVHPTCFPRCTTPRIFEIGRRGAYDLTPDPGPRLIHAPRQLIFPTLQRLTTGIILPLSLITLLVLWLLRFAWSQSATNSIEGVLPVKARQYVSWGLIGSVLLVTFVLWWVWGSNNLAGEPLTFLDGISIWPTELLRLVVALLCLYALGHNRDALSHNAYTMTQLFRLPETNTMTFSLSTFRQSFVSSLLSSVTLRQWHFPMHQSIDNIWKQYQQFSSPASRAGRCLVPVIIFYIFGMVLTSYLGRPHLPYRGEFSQSIDFIVLFVISIPLLLYLTCWIGDATMLCRRFIHQLAHESTTCSTGSTPESETSPQLTKEAHQAWLIIRLIAKRTSVVGQFLLYPFLAVLVMIGARSSYFDHWDFPVGLILIFAVLLAYVLFCAIALRRSANQIRQETLHRLRQHLMAMIGKGKDHASHIQELQFVIDQIQALREGAFLPLAQHPIFRAIFAFGGLSAFTLAEYFGTLY